jgi:hypothetical protein
MFARSDIYFRLHLLLIIITTTCISLSLRRTSAPLHLTSVLGVLGTQETLCIVIARLFERDSFDLLLPEFDKPWVIHLRETCCCSTNLCTWRPNTIYKNRRVRRHHLGMRGSGERTNSVDGAKYTISYSGSCFLLHWLAQLLKIFSWGTRCFTKIPATCAKEVNYVIMGTLFMTKSGNPTLDPALMLLLQKRKA